MSSLDKLLIRGIRSFDPQNATAIEFYSPLTIIVGNNGCGKTTIIECLKYATTGDMPPNSKGGAFIHDPKIAHEVDIKAQVRLKFHNIKRDELVVIRSMQLTQKKTTATFKTLESALIMRNPVTGQHSSISSRCADLNEEISHQLGVSKAILENVIFCHQEESNWPLSEPAILKKKFDEIFAATKYTKALESIKKLRKSQAVEIKLDQQQLEFLAASKQRAEKVEATLATTEASIRMAKTTCDRHDAELERLAADMSQLSEKCAERDQINGRIQSLKQSHRQAEQQWFLIVKSYKEMYEPEDELKAMLAGFDNEQQLRASKIVDLECEQRRYKDEIETMGQRIADNTNTRARHEVKLAAYKEQLASRVTLAQSIIQQHELSCPAFDSASNDGTGELSDEVWQQFIDALDERFRHVTASFGTAKSTAHANDDEARNKLQAIKAELTGLEHSRRIVRTSLDTAISKRNMCNERIANFDVSDLDVADAERRMQTAERSLEAARTAAIDSNPAAQIELKTRELSEIEYAVKVLEGEQRKLLTHMQTRTKLDLHNNELTKLKERLAAATAQYTPELASFLGIDADAPDSPLKDVMRLDAAISAKIRELENELAQMEPKLNMATSKQSSCKAQIDFSEKTLSQQRSTLASNDSKVQAACGDANFSDALAAAENKAKAAMQTVQFHRNANMMYEQYISQTAMLHNCPLCKRGFDSAKAEGAFLADLRESMADGPSRLRDAIEEQSACDKKRDSLRALAHVHEETMNLRSKSIPELEDKLNELRNEQMTASNLVDELRSQITGLRGRLSSAAVIRRRSEELMRFGRDIRRVEGDISQLDGELMLSGVSSTRTLEDCQRDIDVQQEKRKQIQNEVERLNSDSLTRQRELQLFEGRLRTARDDYNSLQQRQQDLAREQAAITELTIEIGQHEAQMADIDMRCSTLNSRVDDANSMVTRVREEGMTAVQVAQSAVDDVASVQRTVSELNDRIAQFRESNTEQRLKEGNELIQKMTTAMDNLKKKLDDAAESIRQLELKQAESKTELRNIQDNLSCRTLQKEMDQHKADMLELTNKANEYSTAAYDAQMAKLRKEQERFLAARAQKQGELKQLEEQARQLRIDLSDDFKDIQQRHLQQAVKCRTQELANVDLDTYSKALDHAIMQYHSQKMEEINKIIRELWVQTYQGNDIDTIEIRSESEGAKNRSSYNYRVVMIKGGTEIDMRGRCSAGQKVLTSLIIRLALAESFCLQCGMLALDEPTTNLDHANMISLATSLANIIKSRRQQRNFQLIVITHDEEFVQNLGKAEYADYYFRVSKNARQHSMIERLPIVTLSR
ncbi:hypothetical protein GQ42DRAFT_21513 [Ramicandelaber brevisporus]|nr:hypothetical protein GQ42DRAFT_21513 [Ramicandelaber brevisporus]